MVRNWYYWYYWYWYWCMILLLILMLMLMLLLMLMYRGEPEDGDDNMFRDALVYMAPELLELLMSPTGTARSASSYSNKIGEILVIFVTYHVTINYNISHIFTTCCSHIYSNFFMVIFCMVWLLFVWYGNCVWYGNFL